MATMPMVPVEEYLATSYPDGDREYLDGRVVERKTLERFREYEKLGVRYIVQTDPVRRTTHMFMRGDLVDLSDLPGFEVRAGESLPFPVWDLLASLDEEQQAEE